MLNFSKTSVMVISNPRLCSSTRCRGWAGGCVLRVDRLRKWPERSKATSLEPSKWGLWEPLTRFFELNINTFISLAYTWA